MAAGTLASQVFSKDIQNTLWPLNDFLSYCKDDTMFVSNDKVNLPHAGTAPAVAEDRTVNLNPTSISKRTDTASQYDLNELSSDPTWLQYSEELIVNYNKRESILGEHRSALQKAMIEKILWKWARGGESTSWTAPTKVSTTGATARATLAPTRGGGAAITGNRKPVTYADILSVVSALNYSDVPADGRIGVIPSVFFSDLLNITEFKSSDYVNVKPLPGAPLSFTWLGMTWFVRSNVTTWATAGTLKDPTAASVATDNCGGIFYHKDYVRAAKGDVKVFLNIDMANMWGSQMSAIARYGAIGSRKDNAGIVNLMETV